MLKMSLIDSYNSVDDKRSVLRPFFDFLLSLPLIILHFHGYIETI